MACLVTDKLKRKGSHGLAAFSANDLVFPVILFPNHKNRIAHHQFSILPEIAEHHVIR